MLLAACIPPLHRKHTRLDQIICCLFSFKACYGCIKESSLHVLSYLITLSLFMFTRFVTKFNSLISSLNLQRKKDRGIGFTELFCFPISTRQLQNFLPSHAYHGHTASN